ncbi:COMM domain-containing protein 6 [Danio rerio]|uniref:COMM domain-containing protein 6 n=1 Tax=Danio rerio TaxID=7955 RepID=E9QCG0_DANRE|nr:COMM domain-containing protein 6 [Danio rerio]|eukprot:XP_001332088.1 COMM domain-containing protein 6 [Danio rerio]
MLDLELSTGADNVVEQIEKLPADMIAETLQTILVHLQDQNRAVDLIETCDKYQRAGINLDQKAVQDIIRLMSHYFRLAAKSNLSADVLVSNLSKCSSKWSKATLQLVQQLWTEHGALLQAHEDLLAMASIGQLVDIQWKLGMAVSSDTCRSLNSPIISVLMKIADTSGEVSYKSFEMTVPQFQNFYRQFKEMASVLETV